MNNKTIYILLDTRPQKERSYITATSFKKSILQNTLTNIKANLIRNCNNIRILCEEENKLNLTLGEDDDLILLEIQEHEII